MRVGVRVVKCVASLFSVVCATASSNAWSELHRRHQTPLSASAAQIQSLRYSASGTEPQSTPPSFLLRRPVPLFCKRSLENKRRRD
eukprot:2795728-Pleurochrysis_carterae.AAC.1